MGSETSASGKYAVLMCGHMIGDIEKRYGDFAAMFEALLKVNGEVWDCYCVVDDQWPAEGVLETYKGIVVTGSASDSFADDAWIVRLRAELASIARKGPQILGICFGCQIMALVLGGKAGRASVGLETGTRSVTWTAEPSLATQPAWASALPQGRAVVIHEMHQDCVQALPVGGCLLASSPATEVEAWCYGGHVLCIQGHPEFSKEFMDELITWRSDTAPEALPPALKEEACMQLSEQPVTKQDVLAMQRLCRAFLTA